MSEIKLYRGLHLHPNVIYYDEIRMYSPGIKVEKNGLFTQRIAVERQNYASETEAKERSLELGKRYIDYHLSGKEELDFYYSE